MWSLQVTHHCCTETQTFPLASSQTRIFTVRSIAIVGHAIIKQ